MFRPNLDPIMVWQQIYTAALNLNSRFLDSIPDEHFFHPPKIREKTIWMTCAFKLAAEGKLHAVAALIARGKRHSERTAVDITGEAVSGLAFSDQHSEVNLWLDDHEHGEKYKAYALRGYALAGNTKFVDAMLEDKMREDARNIGNFELEACKYYAMSGKTVEVDKLLHKNPLLTKYAIQGYASCGHDKQVDDLLAKGGSPELAYNEYINHNFKAKAHQLLVRTQYQRQLAEDKRRVFFVILFAFILTPLSLLISLPILFWKRKNNPIQVLEVSNEEVKNVKDIRHHLRTGHQKHKNGNDNNKKVILSQTSTTKTLLVDKPQLERFKFLQNQDTRKLGFDKHKRPINAAVKTSKAKSVVTHQWLTTGQMFSQDAEREEYRDYMASHRFT